MSNCVDMKSSSCYHVCWSSDNLDVFFMKQCLPSSDLNTSCHLQTASPANEVHLFKKQNIYALKTEQYEYNLYNAETTWQILTQPVGPVQSGPRTNTLNYGDDTFNKKFNIFSFTFNLCFLSLFELILIFTCCTLDFRVMFTCSLHQM